MHSRFTSAALNAFDRGQQLRRIASPQVDLCELPPGGRLLLDTGTDPASVVRSLRELLGLTLPEEPNTMTLGEPSAAWIRPGRFFLFCSSDQAQSLAERLMLALTPYSGFCADVSDAKIGFRICGMDAQDYLASLVSIDLRKHIFSVGNCAQTTLLQARVLIFRTPDGEGFDLHVERSWAPYVWTALVRAGREFGLAEAS